MEGSRSKPRTKHAKKGEPATFHHHCFVCGRSNPDGLRLRFTADGDRIVSRTTLRRIHQSYDGIVHGGIIATLLDAAMTRCLHHHFRHNPLTCRLDVRYLRPVPIETVITIEASFLRRRNEIYWTESIVYCKGRVLARGLGTFKLNE